MKKYVYLVIDGNNEVVAVYENKKTVTRLYKSIEEKEGVGLKVRKQVLNPTIDVIGLSGGEDIDLFKATEKL